MSEHKSSEQIIQDLQKISPLALPQYIAECEFYDSTSSRKILDEAIREFEKDGGKVDSILKPIMLSVADGLIEAMPNTAQLRRNGLTPQRIYNECEAFSYEGELTPPLTSTAYIDYKNAREYTQKFGDAPRRKNYKRTEMDFGEKAKYKTNAVQANGQNKNLMDEYTGKKNITAYQHNADLRRNDPKHHFQAEGDHIIPLHVFYEETKSNYALSKEDIRHIANSDDNFALTNAMLNHSKRDMTNSQYVKENASNLNDTTKERMLQKEKEAQSALDAKTNEIVADNLLNLGYVDEADKKSAYAEFSKENGREPTSKEKEQINERLQKEVKKHQKNKTKKIQGRLLENAKDQAVNCAVGNVIMFIIKPLFFELKDTFLNGFKDGVSAESGFEAIKIRFSRVKEYVMKNAAAFIGENLWDFIKGLVSSLIEGIISLFVGIFKQILKLLKEGIRIFIQSAKIIWGKNSASMSAAEKGDAILKLIGASVMAIAGIGIEALLNKIGIGGAWATVLATMFSGMASALFLYLLDKADFFSVKAERREKRIQEIFDLRKQDLLESTRNFDAAIRNKMREDRIAYEKLQISMDSALEEHDYSKLDQALDGFANFFQIAIPYTDTQSFLDFVKKNKIIKIGECVS